ncbi:hypothetical protein [Halalkalibacter krulwichiae]|uniref:Uncharacterized protein n=1 Tax=Halalkalibacter krulwichiae TaxID=199441 RepID=A0A1X9MGW5_9BACI|nr:hypothetical protein [Halalkalibacter krulwichiae]ARK32719.1 hypothetical protein BkAM31D_24255 [Halalkalibacter krulwichiae]
MKNEQEYPTYYNGYGVENIHLNDNSKNVIICKPKTSSENVSSFKYPYFQFIK